MNIEFTDFSSFLDAVESIISIELQKAKKLLKIAGRDITNIEDIAINSNELLFDILPNGTITRVNLYIGHKSYRPKSIRLS